MAETALIGISLSSRNPSELITAELHDVAVSEGVSMVHSAKGCGGDKAVALEWSGGKGVTSYNIYRAPLNEKDPAKFVLVNDKVVAGTTFTDATAGLVNGVAHSYAIAPVTNGVEGDRLLVQAAPFAQSTPTGYTTTSINEDPEKQLTGCTTTGASFDPATGIITVRGSGADIWTAADEFNFTSTEFEGNFQVTVTALSRPTNTNEWAKAGLMIREGLDAGARDAYLVLTPLQGLVFQWRDTKDGDAAYSDVRTIERNVMPVRAPLMIRMTRTGDEIVGEYSTDNGTTWQGGDVDSNKITLTDLASKVNVGLAITSHQRGAISEAAFQGLDVKKL